MKNIIPSNKVISILFENQHIIRKLAKISEIYICFTDNKFLMTSEGFIEIKGNNNVKNYSKEKRT
jgi:hypothetical protein